MEMLLALGALVLVDILAVRFGVDTRDASARTGR